eukprot:2119279-Rhodomonas_salina.1
MPCVRLAVHRCTTTAARCAFLSPGWGCRKGGFGTGSCHRTCDHVRWHVAVKASPRSSQLSEASALDAKEVGAPEQQRR